MLPMECDRFIFIIVEKPQLREEIKVKTQGKERGRRGECLGICGIKWHFKESERIRRRSLAGGGEKKEIESIKNDGLTRGGGKLSFRDKGDLHSSSVSKEIDGERQLGKAFNRKLRGSDMRRKGGSLDRDLSMAAEETKNIRQP